MKTSWLYILLFALVQLKGYGQQKDIATLNAYFEAAMGQFNLTGMAIGIVKDGKVVFQKGYGLRAVDQPAKVDEHTLFAIASITKAFTVTGLALLEEEGKLQWSDPVEGYLPYFQLHDPYVSSLMTIEDLSCHRSGLATFDGDLLWYGTTYSRKEIVERIRALPLKRSFRSDFGYQNIMYITAGQVIEEVSGLKWDAYIKQRIFMPLGMNATTTSIAGFNEHTNLAYPHLNKRKIDLLNYDNSGATAATNSNVADMCKWIQFWLDQENEKGLVISKENRERMFTPHTNLRVGAFDQRNGTHFKSYGMGWFLMDYNGKKVAHHGGGLPGYISKIALVPEENLGLIVLTNGMSSLPSALMYKIIDFYTDGAERDWASEYHQFKVKSAEREELNKADLIEQRKLNTQPTHQLIDYVGTYADAMYGDATISLKEGNLALVMEPTSTLFSANLNHWHYDTFQFQFADPFLPEGRITFSLGNDGNIAGFTIDLPNPDFHFYNLTFTKKSTK
jgi:CubicO group peptidase (beta-lactamase class C family)